MTFNFIPCFCLSCNGLSTPLEKWHQKKEDVTIIIIIHKFSIALFPAEQAQCAYSLLLLLLLSLLVVVILHTSGCMISSRSVTLPWPIAVILHGAPDHCSHCQCAEGDGQMECDIHTSVASAVFVAERPCPRWLCMQSYMYIYYFWGFRARQS